MTNLIRRFTEKDAGGSYRSYGIFSCIDCSNEFQSRIERINVMTGRCIVCANRQAGNKRKTHGLNNSNSRLHVTWANMKRRCLNPTNKEKRNYGDKVELCDEWMEFEPFMVWALSNGYTEKSTIDRIQGEIGYNPGNCRFVDYCVQSANRMITDKNTSGYIGVSPIDGNRWLAQVQWRGKTNRLGRFKDKEYAAFIRDSYIIDHDLPHKLNHTIDELRQIRKKYAKLARDLEKEIESSQG